MIVSLIEPGPAKAAGLKGSNRLVKLEDREIDAGGDVIVKIEGTDIASMEDLIFELSQYSAGDNVDLEILRNNKRKTFNVKLGELPERRETRPRFFR